MGVKETCRDSAQTQLHLALRAAAGTANAEKQRRGGDNPLMLDAGATKVVFL